MDDSAREAARRFRRRVASGRTEARRRYLTPEVREEAERLFKMLDTSFNKCASPKTRKRIKRIRDGANVVQSRQRNWRQLSLYDDDD